MILFTRGHIADTGRKIRVRIEGKSREDFDRDEDLRIVIAHFVQVIGEAARNISPPLRKDHPEIPWPDMIGMRHRIVHNYMEVDFDIVWDVATIELPKLLVAIERILVAYE